MDLFLQMSVALATLEYENISSYKFTNLNYPVEEFKTELKKYSLDELSILHSEFISLASVIIENGVGTEIYERYFSFYSDRIDYISNEMELRESQLNKIYAVYKLDYSVGNSGVLYDLRTTVNSDLDFKENIGDLWNTFCSYRREGRYSNENYISDNLTNSEIVARADDLFETAKKELHIATQTEKTISASLNNLLALPEFKPITENFLVGNWIRIRMSDYETPIKLRLLSYQIDFSNIQNIDVGFSTIRTIQPNGFSDVQSILNSASSIAGSYSSVVNKVNNVEDTTNTVNSWVNDGLTATNVRYANNNNQTFLVDENGVLARKVDYITQDYDPRQLRILSNGIYITRNNWKTIDVGLGQISYIDPITGEEVNDYGIISKKLVGKAIVGEELTIANQTGNVVIDGDGIMISGGYLRISKDGCTVEIDPAQNYNESNSNVISITSNNMDVFHIDRSGGAYFKGDVHATSGEFKGYVTADTLTATSSGTISSWNFNGNALYRGNANFNNAGSLYFGASGLSITDKFRVGTDGVLHASGADISGTIKCNDGLLMFLNDTYNEQVGYVKVFYWSPHADTWVLTSDTEVHFNNGLLVESDFYCYGIASCSSLKCDRIHGTTGSAIIIENPQSTSAGDVICKGSRYGMSVNSGGVNSWDYISSTWAEMNASAFNKKSSKRYKHNIQNMTDEQMNKILDINVVSFNYNDTDRFAYGVIAEEAYKIIPESVTMDPDDETLPDAVDYSSFVPFLIKKVQNQNEKIQILQNEINKLKEL